jgi:hypothetical protein
VSPSRSLFCSHTSRVSCGPADSSSKNGLPWHPWNKLGTMTSAARTIIRTAKYILRSIVFDGCIGRISSGRMSARITATGFAKHEAQDLRRFHELQYSVPARHKPQNSISDSTGLFNCVWRTVLGCTQMETLSEQKITRC